MHNLKVRKEGKVPTYYKVVYTCCVKQIGQEASTCKPNKSGFPLSFPKWFSDDTYHDDTDSYMFIAKLRDESSEHHRSGKSLSFVNRPTLGSGPRLLRCRRARTKKVV